MLSSVTLCMSHSIRVQAFRERAHAEPLKTEFGRRLARVSEIRLPRHVPSMVIHDLDVGRSEQ